MSADATIDPKFEIGHVLFIDIVGYSKLLIGEQSELVRELKEVVATSEQVRVAEEQGRLLSLPTGDGVALVFRTLRGCFRAMCSSDLRSSDLERTLRGCFRAMCARDR